MIDRAERTGFGVALLGHLLLFGALSVGLALHRPRLPPVQRRLHRQPDVPADPGLRAWRVHRHAAGAVAADLALCDAECFGQLCLCHG